MWMLYVKVFANACVRECRRWMGLNDGCVRRCCVRGYRLWSLSAYGGRVYICCAQK